MINYLRLIGWTIWADVDGLLEEKIYFYYLFIFIYLFIRKHERKEEQKSQGAGCEESINGKRKKTTKETDMHAFYR